jgi:hypothetical protein
MNDLVHRLRKRAEIRRQISTRKSVQEGKPDRISDLLEEAADYIESKQYRTFEDWFYELEQHNTRACRLWAELDYDGEQYNVIKEWLRAAYEAGVDKELK